MDRRYCIGAERKLMGAWRCGFCVMSTMPAGKPEPPDMGGGTPGNPGRSIRVFGFKATWTREEAPCCAARAGCMIWGAANEARDAWPC